MRQLNFISFFHLAIFTLPISSLTNNLGLSNILGRGQTSLNASICIDNFGCFDPTGAFILNAIKRHVSVNVSMCLHTRTESLDKPLKLDINTVAQLANSNFDFDEETKFIIPGWQSKKDSAWIKAMVKELLIQDNYNVFVINWAEYLTNILYNVAAADTKLVGAKVARFIQLLRDTYRYPLNKIHLIGHSLGAHISGFAGSKFSGQIARISGLDPAGPLFDGQEADERLDPTDAAFVDVIHTNAGSLIKNKHFGIIQTCGHVDFYPNGGWIQPACVPVKSAFWTLIKMPGNGNLNEMMHAISCNHGMAIQYFIQSINHQCQFQSRQCSDFSTFLSGHCDVCNRSHESPACVDMGFHAKWRPLVVAERSFFLKTTNCTKSDQR